MTSWLTNFNAFQAESWRKHATSPGKVNIDLLKDITLQTLYGLASDDRVESRVLEQIDEHFNLTLGPFETSNQEALGAGQMLMVQNLESFIPAVSEWLSREFSFLPRWRIEDVMATAANKGGNCGAHFDQYDVFLVQIRGHKSWSLDDGGHTASELSQEADIRLLEQFEATHFLQQHPGDVLYIPPGVGHHGIASDDSITLSVGIRNPLLSEMASYLADMLILEGGEGASLNDQLLGTEIDPLEVANLGSTLSRALTQPNIMNRWYGCYMTEPRDPELLHYPESEIDPGIISSWLASRTSLTLELPARIALQADTLFVNGEALHLGRKVPWLLELQQQRSVAVNQLGDDIDVLMYLAESGALAGFPPL